MKVRKRWNPRNLIIFLSIILVSVTVMHIFGSVDPINAAGEKKYINVVVHQGDSLWQLVTQYVPERDPRVVIAEVMKANDLSDPTIMPGQVLTIPKQDDSR